MDLERITAHEARAALRAIRQAASLDTSSLLGLHALRLRARAEGLADTPAVRSSLLGHLLFELIRDRLDAHRGGDTCRTRGERSPDSELSALQRDFGAWDITRQAWGVLMHRYFATRPLPIREMESALGISKKTYERRLTRGYHLLAEALRVAEAQALTADAPAHNLPRLLTGFIGRERELAEIWALLEDHRVVVLTGMGGIGKSRLAAEVAAHRASAFDDGAWFVGLAAIEEDRHVPQAVADALGARDEPGRSVLDTIVGHLAAKRSLLVLDNCEHVVVGASALVDAILAGCSRVRVLATSREALHVRGSSSYAVQPLSLPAEAARLAADQVLDCDAVRLFDCRARAVRPDVLVDARNAAQVARLCARLDGIPLAIELAAARIRYVSLEQLEERLADRFVLLQDGRYAARPGHETMRLALDMSYELLRSAEQALYRRLAVFRGGWTLEAAEAICAGDGIGAGDVLELLAQLDAKSLLRLEHVEGATRFDMLETVRQHAWSKLEQNDEVAPWCDRHVAHFAGLTAEARPELRGPQGAHWLDRLEREHHNLMRAIRWARARGDASAALGIVGGMFAYWMMRGRLSEGRAVVTDVLSMPIAPGDAAAYACALDIGANLACMQSDFTTPRPLYAESLRIYRELQEPTETARVLSHIGLLEWQSGHLEPACRAMEEGLAIARTTNDSGLVIDVLNNLGLIRSAQGDRDGERRCLEEALALARSTGDRQAAADILGNLGNLALSVHDLESAQRYYHESLHIKREFGDKHGLANALLNCGALSHSRGDFDAMIAHYGEGLALWRELGSEGGASLANLGLAEAAMGQGDLEAARARLIDSLSTSRRIGDEGQSIRGLLVWARYESARARHAAACRMAAAAVTAWESRSALPDLERAEYEAVLDAARSALDADDLGRALAQGRAQTLDEALACALGGSACDALAGALSARSAAAEPIDGPKGDAEPR